MSARPSKQLVAVLDRCRDAMERGDVEGANKVLEVALATFPVGSADRALTLAAKADLHLQAAETLMQTGRTASDNVASVRQLLAAAEQAADDSLAIGTSLAATKTKCQVLVYTQRAKEAMMLVVAAKKAGRLVGPEAASLEAAVKEQYAAELAEIRAAGAAVPAATPAPAPGKAVPSAAASAAPKPAPPAAAPAAAAAATGGGSMMKAGFLQASGGNSAGPAKPAAAGAAPSVPSAADVAALSASLAAQAAAPAAPALPSRQQQRYDVGRLVAQYAHRGLQAGDEYAVVPAGWWQRWCRHVGRFSDADDVAPAGRLLRSTDRADLPLDDARVAAEWPALAKAARLDADAASAAAGSGDSGSLGKGARKAATSAAPPAGGDDDEDGPGALEGGDVDIVDAASAPPPGRIDPLPLLDVAAMAAASGNSAQQPQPQPLLLRKDLMEQRDFVIVGGEVYNALEAWYGSAGPRVTRLAVPVPADLEEAVASAASPSTATDSDDYSSDEPADASDGNDDEIDGASRRRRRPPARAAADTSPPKRVRCVIDVHPDVTAAQLQKQRDAAVAAAAASPSSPAAPTPCYACGTVVAQSYRCGTCKTARYCSEGCQRAHWPKHKPLCAPAGSAGGRRSSLDGAGGFTRDGQLNGLRGECCAWVTADSLRSRAARTTRLIVATTFTPLCPYRHSHVPLVCRPR